MLDCWCFKMVMMVMMLDCWCLKMVAGDDGDGDDGDDIDDVGALRWLLHPTDAP